MSQRRLAAIMHIEFVSRHALKATEFSEDKVSALKLITEKHSGHWSRYQRNTYVSLFDSALDAVNAALQILKESNSGLDDKTRIGIHLGDVIVDGDEIQGEGIEMASRISSIAEPGSLLISEAVYGAVKGVGHIHAELLGERVFNDTDEIVRIYQVGSESDIGIQRGRSRKKYLIPAIIVLLLAFIGIWQFTSPEKEETTKTILILPFEFVEADSANEHVVNWVLTELIRNLGNTNSLTVFNQATSNVFNASLVPVADARDRLDQTDFFIHGAIKTESTKITIEAEIYDREEMKIWSESYSKTLDSLSWLTNKIAIDIIEALEVKLAVKEYRRIEELEPIETEQYELLSKARNELGKWTPEAFANAKVYLKEMVDNNPTSSRGWAMHAQGLISMGHSGFPPEGIWIEAKEAAERALRLDSLNANAWAALACAKTYGEQDFEGAVHAYKKANALNPNMGWNHYHYAWHLYLYDQLDEAIIEHTIAQELDPLMPGHTFWLGYLLIEAGEFDQALAEAERLVRITNDSSRTYTILGNIYFKREMYDSALHFYEKAKNNAGVARSKFYLGDKGPVMTIVQNIKERPLNSWRAHRLATIYAEMDSLDRFFEYANYEPPSYATPYLRKLNTNPKVFEDPRFRELMVKFDLPMPKGYE